MNRPSEKYCFLADKHYSSNIKLLRAFAIECINELKNNPDGIQFPFFHIKLVKKKSISYNNSVRKKYGENYVFTNDHTDGYVITNQVSFKSNEYNNKNYSIANKWYFKFQAHKPLKKAQMEVAKSNYADFDTKYK